MIDASALVAILAAEPDRDAFAEVLEKTRDRFTTPLAMFEATAAMSRKGSVGTATLSPQQAAELLQQFCSDFGIAIRPIDAPQHRLATEAATRFGKGRHVAALNMGDCFAYAAARHHATKLIYKGRDFAETDLAC
jgi:ribonuclease VapC